MLRKCIQAGRVTCTSLLYAGLLAGAGWRASALESVEIAWDASDSGDVVNYNLYYWPDGGSTIAKLTVGEATTATVPGLAGGATYNFYITATDGAGLESAPSATVSYTVPVPVMLRMQAVKPGSGAAAVSITATGDLPAQWALECSTNLQAWAVYATGTNTAVNVQIPNTLAAQIFFRLRGL